MKIDKITLLFVVFAWLLCLIPTIKSTLSIGVTAEDWTRHSLWINMYLDGNYYPFSIYPPFYHLFMIPFVLHFGNYIYIMQPIFLTISFFSILFFVNKYENNLAVILTALILSTSLVFLQFSPALMPQTLDYALFPIAIMLFLDKRYGLSASLVWFLMGTHLVGIFFWTILFFYSLLVDKKYIKYLLFVLLLSIAFYPCYSQGIIIKESILTNRNAEFLRFQYWSNPFELYHTYPIHHFLLFSGFLIWFLLPLTIWSMYKLKRYNKIHLIYAVWFIVFLPLGIFAIWRWWSYAVIPVALFTASIISKYIDFYDNKSKE